MKMTKCIGCGAELQSSDPRKPGYTPKQGSSYCQRCFRLTHYDDLTVSMRTGIDPDEVMKKAAEMDAVILWVIDLFDFEAGIIPGINRHLSDKDIILAATKRDILPATLSDDKAAAFVFERLQEMGIQVNTLILTDREDEDAAEEIRQEVRMLAAGRPAVVIGRANSGKSTLLNRLSGNETLTISRHPGTTIDFNEIMIGDQLYIDTPGIEIENSILMDVNEKDLKTVIPQSRIKPRVYQLKGDQSFAIGGLARLDLAGCEKASCVFYVSDRLDIHRGKLSGADELWKKHRGSQLVPAVDKKETSVYTKRKTTEKMDIVIDGLGWACVNGNMKNVTVHVPKGVSVTFRKAML